MRKLLSQAFKRAAKRLYCDLCDNRRVVDRGSTGTTAPCPQCRLVDYGNWIDNSPEHQAVTASPWPTGHPSPPAPPPRYRWEGDGNL